VVVNLPIDKYAQFVTIYVLINSIKISYMHQRFFRYSAVFAVILAISALAASVRAEAVQNDSSVGINTNSVSEEAQSSFAPTSTPTNDPATEEESGTGITTNVSDEETQDSGTGIDTNSSSEDTQDEDTGINTNPVSEETQDGDTGIDTNPVSEETQDGSDPDDNGGDTPNGGNGDDDDDTDTVDDGDDDRSSTGGGRRFLGGGRGGAEEINGNEPVVIAPIAGCTYLAEYMRYGAANNPFEVHKLQVFLKNYENLDVDITGIFDSKTLAAVNQFQQKYVNEIMGPWGASIPSGQVYITTVNKINEIFCNNPMALTAEQLAIIAAYKNRQDAITLAQGGTRDRSEVNGGDTAGDDTDTSSEDDGENGEEGDNQSASAATSFTEKIKNFFKRIFDFIFKR